MVLKGCGPKGYPGMAEVGNMALPPKILRKGITDMVRISDARMSGTAYGTVVLHVAPESAAGGPLALVKTGDVIELDVPARKLHLDVSDAELAKRRAAWEAPETPKRGYYKLYVEHVQQADKGADLDFLVGGSGTTVTRDSSLRLRQVGKRRRSDGVRRLSSTRHITVQLVDRLAVRTAGILARGGCSDSTQSPLVRACAVAGAVVRPARHGGARQHAPQGGSARHAHAEPALRRVRVFRARCRTWWAARPPWSSPSPSPPMRAPESDAVAQRSAPRLLGIPLSRSTDSFLINK